MARLERFGDEGGPDRETAEPFTAAILRTGSKRNFIKVSPLLAPDNGNDQMLVYCQQGQSFIM